MSHAGVTAGEKWHDLCQKCALHRIDTNFLIKITDFGLSEDVYAKNYFRQGSSGGVVKLPVKWMAPESLTDGLFSQKSDVVSHYALYSTYTGETHPLKTLNKISVHVFLLHFFNTTVVIWYHNVGDFQWRESPISWRRSTYSDTATGGWT